MRTAKQNYSVILRHSRSGFFDTTSAQCALCSFAWHHTNDFHKCVYVFIKVKENNASYFLCMPKCPFDMPKVEVSHLVQKKTSFPWDASTAKWSRICLSFKTHTNKGPTYTWNVKTILVIQDWYFSPLYSFETYSISKRRII